MATHNYIIGSLSWGGAAIAGSTGYAIQTGRATRIIGTSGSHHSRLAAAVRYAQAVVVQSSGLASLLAKMGSSGTYPVPCQALNGTTNQIILSAQALDDVLPAASATASDDELITISNGLATIRSISWGGPGEGAQVELAIYPVSSDGTTDPMVKAAGTIPTIAAADEDMELSAPTWNSIALEGLTNLRLTMDTAPSQIWNPGKIYAQYLRQAPATGPVAITASFTLPDRSLLRSWGPHFQGAALANLVLPFAPLTQAAAIGAVSKTFTLAGALEVTDANDGRPGSINCLVHGISSNGTTPALSWA